MPFRNPIVAGNGALIREAIKSPNYVAGVSGWSINKDGSMEMNDAVVRGEFSAGGGVVTMNENGVIIEFVDFDQTTYVIEMSEAVSGIMITTSNPFDPTASTETRLTRTLLSLLYQDSGTSAELDAVAGMSLSEPALNTKVQVNSQDIFCSDPATPSRTPPYIQRGSESVSAAAVSSVTTTVTYPYPIPASFPIPTIEVGIQAPIGSVPRAWVARAHGVGRLTFSLTIYSVDGTTATFANQLVTWVASCKMPAS